MDSADAVTIPMQKKDSDGNVMNYRVTPLAFEDKRFEIIRATLGRDLRTKFMKLYKKTKDAGARTPAVEMSAFLAAFTFEQLIGWYGVLVEITNDPKSAALNTFHIFGETFKHLTGDLAEMAHGEEKEVGSEAAEGDQAADGDPDTDDAAGPGEPEPADDTDSPSGGEDEGRPADDAGESGDVDPEDAEAGPIALPVPGNPLDRDPETRDDG